DSARVLLQVEAPGTAERQLRTHPRPHLRDLVLQPVAGDVMDEDLAPLGLERGADRAGARERAAEEERLMLVDPCLVALVAAKVVEARDHEAGAAARPEPRIDLVEPPGARLDRQEMDQALHEAREEPRVIDHGGASRLLM